VPQPAKLRFFINSNAIIFAGWKYFWAKKVSGFNPDVHCARCLIGPYEKKISTRALVNVEVDLTGYSVGDIVYVCGVASPYKWANNFHLAARVTEGYDKGEYAVGSMASGDQFFLRGAAKIPFTAEAAERAFAGRGKDFLTCRNFQFGAAMAGQFACR
jgi:hypothetical protein